MYLHGKYNRKKAVGWKRILAMYTVCCMLLGLSNINMTAVYAEGSQTENISSENTGSDRTDSGQTNDGRDTDQTGKDSSTGTDNASQTAGDQGNITDSNQTADQGQNQTNSAQQGNDSVGVQAAQNNIDASQMLGQFLTRLGLSPDVFTVENIQAAGIKDPNFAQAVYDSMLADQDNFRKQIEVDHDSGNILKDGEPRLLESMYKAGTNEGIISAGAPDVPSGLRLILSFFSGSIDAKEKNIQSIEGIKILRKALKIDLRDNQITDISGLEKGNGEIITVTTGNDPKSYKNYFGESWSNKSRNVYVYFDGNPVKTLYGEANGRLIVDLTRGGGIPLTDVSLTYAVDGTEKNGFTTPFFDAELFYDKKSLPLSTTGVNMNEGSTITIDPKDIMIKAENGGFQGITVHGIKNTGLFYATFSYEAEMVSWVGADNGATSPVRHSTVASKKVNVNVYTNVKVEYTSNGCILLKKQDEQGKAITGAEFNLYKCGDPSDTLIPEDTAQPDVGKVYKTDENGEILVSGLEDGEYYFVETKLPEGYQQEIYGNTSYVPDAAGSGKTISFDIKENDRSARYALYKMAGQIQGTDDTCVATGLKTGADGKVTYDVSENGTYYLVKSDVLKVTNVTKRDITLDNSSRKSVSDPDKNLSAWEGDSIAVTNNDDGTTAEKRIDTTEKTGGFFVKGAVPEKVDADYEPIAGTGEKTADQIAFKYQDTDSSPLYEITLKWTKALGSDDEATSGKMTYRIRRDNEKDTSKVTYCADSKALKDAVKDKLQALAGVEYRNVEMNVEFGDGGNDKWSVDKTRIPTTTVTNPKTTTLKVYKQDDAGKMLENAEFTLYRKAAEGETDTEKLKVGNTTIDAVAVTKQVTKKESGNTDKAVAEFKDLPNSSTFYIAETKLPTGHQYIKKDNDKYEAAIGKVYVVKTDKYGDVTIDGAKAEGTSKGHVFSITFTNVGISLPKTGFGGGYTLYTLLAMLVIGSAGAWLYLNRKKKISEGK